VEYRLHADDPVGAAGDDRQPDRANQHRISNGPSEPIPSGRELALDNVDGNQPTRSNHRSDHLI
jgi:hypothetical protein